MKSDTTSTTESVVGVGHPRFVRHPLILPKRARWFYAESQDQEEWEGPFKTLEEALYDAVQQREECAPRMNGTEPIWVGHGTRTRKSEREEWGGTFDFFVDSTEAIQICLPNASVEAPNA
jgi:hypothetical protein